MSKATVDFRGKVTEETHAVLEALSRTTGKSYQEIARDWLHERALEQIHTASVLHGILQAQGLPGVAGGNLREVRGSRGNDGEPEAGGRAASNRARGAGQ